MTTVNANINQEIARRRTFAIISHPDAGKTTLTEKLLLYGGAIRLAGTVTARKKQSDTASDWMELEKKRGISVSSTLLQFDYEGYRLNLLDTPGHKDFSEDTYRVLTAVDGVIMVLDGGKGIEKQTLKLFEICRNYNIPLFTFINKMDREAKPPLELIDEIESALQVHAVPVNWPMGMGDTFQGVYDRLQKQLHLFERLDGGGAHRAPVKVHDLKDPQIKEILDKRIYELALEELELLDVAHESFDPASVLEGTTTPVYFGSAVNNFGVQLLLDGFLKYSSEPRGRKTTKGFVEPQHEKFSAYIFKIQTNMDPLHRDRIAFLRVCSGQFSRDKALLHSGTGKKFKLAHAHRVFGREREVVEEAYAGDIIGVVGKDEFKVGDTLTEDPGIVFNEVLTFVPECFATLSNPEPSKYKRYRKGVEHLLAENIVQSFQTPGFAGQNTIYGAVGPLQFEVLQYRLQSEYGAPSTLTLETWAALRWLERSADLEEIERIMPYRSKRVLDIHENSAILFHSKWALEIYMREHENIVLLTSPPL